MKKRIMAILLTMIMLVGLLPTTAFAANWDPTDEITITVRVYDESTSNYFVVGTDTCTKGDQYIQSDDYTIPPLTEFVDASKFGRVVKVVGNWYFPTGDRWPGSVVNWSCNSSTGTMTYWVTSYNPAGGGGGSTQPGVGVPSDAVWRFHLDYNLAGGSNSSSFPRQSYGTTSKYEKSHTFSTHTVTPVREGYVFDHWQQSGSINTTRTLGANVLVTATGISGFNGGTVTDTLTAVWEKVESTPATPVTVTYMDRGSICATMSAFVGDTMTAINNTTPREGYTFSGWDTSSAAANVVYTAGQNFIVNSDITLYAVWEEILPTTYTVTYTDGVAEEVVFEDQVKIATAGDPTPAFSGTPEREGYIFTGWAPEVAETVTDNATYTAQWEAVPEYTYILIYDGNGDGVQNVPAQDTYGPTTAETYGFTVIDQEPAREGYDFLGWADTDDATQAGYPVGSTVNVTRDAPTKTIYAVWERNNRIVLTYDANGGTGNMLPDSKEVVVGANATFTLAENSFTAPEGKRFRAWNTQADGKGVSYNSGDTLATDKDVTLYAIWENKPYNNYGIWYKETNDGSGEQKFVAEPSRLDAYTVTVKAYTDSKLNWTVPEDRVFLGWTTGKGSDTVTHRAGDPVELTVDHLTITLYPVFHTHTWTYEDNHDGTHTGHCDCGAETAPEAHTPATGWLFSGEEHWQRCSVCNGISGTAPHDFESKITTEATCTEAGVKTYTCTVCGYQMTEEIPATGHKDEDANGKCDACGICLHVKDAGGFCTVDGCAHEDACCPKPLRVVTFDPANGNDPFTVEVQVNTPVAEPDEPTRDGYVFAGWYNGDEQYDFDAPVTEALTLTAKWEALCTVNVVIYRNGNTDKAYQTVSLPKMKKGETLDVSGLNIKDYYAADAQFEGWYNDGGWNSYKNGNPNNTLGDTITINGWTNISCMVTDYETVTVRAVVDGDKENAETVLTGKTLHGADLNAYLTEHVTVEERTGYTLDQWYNWDWYGHKIGDNATVNGWTNVYVTYTANTYTVTFDANADGEVEDPAPQSVKYGKTATDPRLTRENWVPLGWFTEGSDTPYDFATPVTGDLTLTARWEKGMANKPNKKLTKTDVDKMHIRAYAVGTEVAMSTREMASCSPSCHAKGVSYTIGEVYGNDVDGYRQDVTFTFTSGDAFEKKASSVFLTHGGLTDDPEWVGDSWVYDFDYEGFKASQTLTFLWKVPARKWSIEGSNANNITSAVANYIKAYLYLERTVTYTDGVDGQELFADQVYKVRANTETPAFVGTPTREGWEFRGWNPTVSEAVTGDVTYTAIWAHIDHAWSDWTENEDGTGHTRSCACGETETEPHKERTYPNVKYLKSAATCTEPAVYYYSCAVCGAAIEEKTFTSGKALGHDWNDGEVTTQPTCTEDGVKTFTCQREGCGETRTEAIPATGHTEEVIPGKAPTCTETGLTEGKKCSVCGEILLAQEVIPALGHKERTYPNVKYLKSAATCTEPAVYYYSCAVCGAAIEEKTFTSGKALGHDWNEGVITTEPNCTKEGVKTFTCNRCGETRTEAIPATGHTEEVIPGKAPTCTETGLTEGRKCSVCGEILLAQEVIPALDHDWGEWTQTKAPTCTEKGEEERICKRDASHKETREIAALGHTLTHVEAKDANCTDAGNLEYWYCSTCEKYFKDEACTTEITLADTVIPAVGHKYEDVVTAPTCTTQGYTTHTCSVCGNQYVDAYVNALGHVKGSWEVVRYPTERTEGKMVRKCARCGVVLEESVIPRRTGTGGASRPVDDWPFVDVGKRDDCYEAVKYVYENGLMVGTSADRFSPNREFSRAMVAMILYRMEKTPDVTFRSVFPDVTNHAWYADAITWAYNYGVVNGYGNGNFGPDDSVTVEQLLAILYRYAKSEGYDVSGRGDLNRMTDSSDISGYAVNAVRWAVSEGLVSGRGRLYPRAAATRAQVAEILMNFCENVL